MNRFDDQLRQKLVDHSSPVPTDAWDKINAGLVQDTSGRYIAFYWMMGLFIITLVGLLTFLSLQNEAEQISVLELEEQSSPVHHNEDTYIVPMNSEVDESGTDDINNLVITKSSFKNNTKVDVSDSSFIKNLRAIQESKK